jgi:hypothetical protein
MSLTVSDDPNRNMSLISALLHMYIYPFRAFKS